MLKIKVSAGYSKRGACMLISFYTFVHHVIARIRALRDLTRVDSFCSKLKIYEKDLIDDLEIFDMSSRYHIDEFIIW